MNKEDYAEPFEISDEIGNFIEQYDLWDDLEITGDVSEYTKQEVSEKEGLKLVKSDIDLDEPYARIKDKVAEDLAQTYKVFTEEDDAYKSLDGTKKRLEADVNQMIKELAKEAGLEADFVEAEVSYDTGDSRVSYSVELTTEDDENEFYPSSLTWETSDENISDSAESYNWLAWLGAWNSPFHDDVFLDGYKLSEAASAIDELWSASYVGENGGNVDRDALADVIWALMDQEGDPPGSTKPKFKDPGKNEIEKIFKQERLKEGARDKKHLQLVKTSLVAALRKLVI